MNIKSVFYRVALYTHHARQKLYNTTQESANHNVPAFFNKRLTNNYNKSSFFLSLQQILFLPITVLIFLTCYNALLKCHLCFPNNG